MVGGPYNEGCASELEGCARTILALVAIAAVLVTALRLAQLAGWL